MIGANTIAIITKMITILVAPSKTIYTIKMTLSGTLGSPIQTAIIEKTNEQKHINFANPKIDFSQPYY